jgi:hypothetical protein
MNENALSNVRLTLDIATITTAEIVVLVDVLDQLLAQLWRDHGGDISDFMLADRRRRERERAQQELPF